MDELTPQDLPKEVYERKESLPLLYRPAVLMLGAIGAACIVGMIVLPVMGQAVSEGLVAIGSLAVGALANMVAQESRSSGN